MIPLLAVLAGIATVELFVRLPLAAALASVTAAIRKAFRVIASRSISDHWKERAVPAYALQIFRAAFRMVFFLVVALSPVALVGILVQLAGQNLFGFLMRPVGIALVTGVSILWAVVRRKSGASDSPYTPMERALHHVALGNTIVARATFDMGQAGLKTDPVEITGEKHVFVAGLARAGTTLLMRLLYSTGRFRSLTYRDMPFVLMPGLWTRMSRSFQKKGEAHERAHGDGMLVDYDSPEAMEEVFWRVFNGKDYIRRDSLVPMVADEESVERFRSYVASLIAAADGDKRLRYLSKNNNNILRLSSIETAFPGSVILIPFRDPVQQAHSLLSQHRRFVVAHAEDSFSRRYMTWLGHHEFGSDHRPFRFGADNGQFSDPDDINYWLELWVHVYSRLNAEASATARFVCYESLCRDFAGVWSSLAERADLPVDTVVADDVELKVRQVDDDTDPALTEQACLLYKDLVGRAMAAGNEKGTQNDRPVEDSLATNSTGG